MSRVIESGKIALLCIGGAALYGIVHDQFTARIYLPYFTEFHPRIVDSNDPTVLAFAWGVVATWWVGAVLSIALSCAALGGDAPPTPFKRLLRSVGVLLVVMAIIAASIGLTAYRLDYHAPGFTVQADGPFPTEQDLRLYSAVWLTHSASYASGGLGGIVLCLYTFVKRQRSNGLSRSGRPVY